MSRERARGDRAEPAPPGGRRPLTCAGALLKRLHAPSRRAATAEEDPARPPFWLAWDVDWPEGPAPHQRCGFVVAPTLVPSWVVGRTTERVLAHAVAVAARTRHELLFSSELTLPPSAREDSREELAHAAVLRTDLVLDEFSWTVMGSASPQLVTDLPGGGLEVWDTAVERSALRARLLPQLVPFWAEHVNGLRAQGRLR